jgi:hypothetical protein
MTEFELFFEEILRRGSPYSYSIFPFVQNRLKQFHIESRIEVEDILIEAYMRGSKKIRAGDTIYNPLSWLKSTCFNIIRERSRQLRPEISVEPESIGTTLKTISNDFAIREAINDDLQILDEALKRLQVEVPINYKLLELKVLQKMSWKEVRRCLTIEEGRNISDQALRQRLAQVKKRLRAIFHELI